MCHFQTFIEKLTFFLFYGVSLSPKHLPLQYSAWKKAAYSRLAEVLPALTRLTASEETQALEPNTTIHGAVQLRKITMHA